MNIAYFHNGDFSIMNANKIQVRLMCNGFKDLGHKVTLYCFGSEVPGIDTVVLPNNNYYLRSIILAVKSLFIRTDKLFTRDIFCAVISQFKNDTFYELHDVPKSILWRLLFFLYRGRIIVISKGLQNVIQRPCLVLPDAIHKSLLDYSPKKSIDKLGVPNEYYLYSGSLLPWKGVDVIVKAAKQLPKKNFVIIGADRDYCENNVVYKKFMPQSDLFDYYYYAKGFILPTSGKFDIGKYYTSPLKLFEYMAFEKPIYASDLPSIREVGTFNFFEADNPDDLVNALSTKSKITVNKFITWKERAEMVLK